MTTDVTWVPTLQFRYVVKPQKVIVQSDIIDPIIGEPHDVSRTYKLPMLEQLWAKREFTEAGWGQTISSEWREIRVEDLK